MEFLDSKDDYKAGNHWTRSLDNGNDVDIINLDFHKAFNCVPHQRLLSKLRSYGISGIVLNWITDSLSNRQQRVNVNGSYPEQSKWCFAGECAWTTSLYYVYK